MRVLALALVLLAIASPLSAVDWSACTDALGSLRRAAESVADESRRAEAASEEVDSATEELRNCRDYPGDLRSA